MKYIEVKPGMKFGQWTVLALGQRGPFTFADCRCTCGQARRIGLNDLLSNKTLRCAKCRDLRFTGAARRTTHPDTSRAAQKLHAKRLSLNLSQGRFSHLLGVHWLTISHWENGYIPVPVYVTKAASKLKKGKR